MTTPTVAKKDITKLQRAIVDGLEDVKAQDIQVFDTEHLSALFERVVVASGTSNRQTKGLAASVLDAVRKAGFPKPRVEGEANGEWIIVDCGQAVVHIMQPSFRQYYNLEELWGEKPVRLKLGAAKPAVAEAAKSVKPAKAAPKVEMSLKRSNAAKKGVEEAFPSKAQLKKAAAAKKTTAAKAPVRKAAAPKAAGAAAPAKKATPAKKAAAKTVTKVVVKATAKTVAKAAAKKTAARKA
ncbi:MAG: ribosome silencing factor [Rhodoferax sp.]